VDGNLSPRAKKLALQVSKGGYFVGASGLFSVEIIVHLYIYIYRDVCLVNTRNFYVQVKNKPCVKFTTVMQLISWIHTHGCETSTSV
jgi:hypothetical protein